MRAILRRILLSLGLTGKLLLLAGGILAISLGLLVGLAWWGAGRTIRDELEKTQKVRVLDWAARHLDSLESEDRWGIASAVEELGDDPYVLYAGIFDKAGMPVAGVGDEEARNGVHTLDFIQILRSGPIGEFAAAPEGSKPAPLPGLVRSPGEESPGATFRERFASVLGDMGNRTEDLVGFAEITMDTAPLDRLAARVMGPLAILAGLLFVTGVAGTLLLVRNVTRPLRMLKEQAALLAAGETDLRFREIPRPLDEVGDLATHFSVMAESLARSRADLEEDLRRREAAAREETERLRRRIEELERS